MRTALHQRLLHTFGDGRLERLHGRSDVVVVRADAGETISARARSTPAGQLRDRVVEQHRAAGVAGLEVIAGRVDGSPGRVGGRVGRRQQLRFLEQLGLVEAPRARTTRGFVECSATSASGPSAASAT